MSQSFFVPEGLKPQSTRDELDQDKLLAQFQKLNSQYNKMIETQITNKTEGKLNFKEDDVFYMIKKAREEIKFITKENNEISNTLKEYNSSLNELNDIIEIGKKITEKYYKLSSTTQPYNVLNKLCIKNKLIPNEIEDNIIKFKNDLKVEIDEMSKKIKDNKKRISDFNKLVFDSLNENNDETNMQKNERINICSVCMTHKINICLNPCGHTFCSKCVRKMNSTCGMCRSNYFTQIKLFIADMNNDDISDEEPEEELLSDWNVTDDILSSSLGSSFFSGFSVPIERLDDAPWLNHN
jgi:hypothetical protein